jgi:Bacterial transcriptional activator domain
VATECRAGADLGLGRPEELAGELEVLCREHPLRERLWELLILVLYRSGRQAEALRAYTEVRDHLADELGLDPGPALRELQARILVQDPSLAPASAPSRPAPVPAGGTVAAPVTAGNLRELLGRFVGRDAELAQLREAVRSSRLVTLTGPGGAGKTRLAVEAAAALRLSTPTVPGWLSWPASPGPTGWCRPPPPRSGRPRRRSQALSRPDRPPSSSCGTWPDGRWSSSSTTASTSSTRRPR